MLSRRLIFSFPAPRQPPSTSTDNDTITLFQSHSILPMPFWCFKTKDANSPRPATPGLQNPVPLVRIATPVFQNPPSRPRSPAGTLRIATPLLRNTISRPQTPVGTAGISALVPDPLAQTTTPVILHPIPLVQISTPLLGNPASGSQTPNGTTSPSQITGQLNQNPPATGNSAVTRYIYLHHLSI